MDTYISIIYHNMPTTFEESNMFFAVIFVKTLHAFTQFSKIAFFVTRTFNAFRAPINGFRAPIKRSIVA